jgi:hypothetical protein
MSDEQPIKAKKSIKAAGRVKHGYGTKEERTAAAKEAEEKYNELLAPNADGEMTTEQYIEDSFFSAISDPEKMKQIMEKAAADKAAREGFQQEKLDRGESLDAPIQIELGKPESEEAAETTKKETKGKARRVYAQKRKTKKD